MAESDNLSQTDAHKLLKEPMRTRSESKGQADGPQSTTRHYLPHAQLKGSGSQCYFDLTKTFLSTDSEKPWFVN